MRRLFATLGAAALHFAPVVALACPEVGTLGKLLAHAVAESTTMQGVTDTANARAIVRAGVDAANLVLPELGKPTIDPALVDRLDDDLIQLLGQLAHVAHSSPANAQV